MREISVERDFRKAERARVEECRVWTNLVGKTIPLVMG